MKSRTGEKNKPEVVKTKDFFRSAKKTKKGILALAGLWADRSIDFKKLRNEAWK